MQAGPPLHVVVDWHLLATHFSPVGQGKPQPPQFSGSLLVSVHPTEQQASPPVQAGSPWQLVPGMHRLSTQDSPVGHGCPQLPQFLGSLEVSSHPVGQHWAGAAHAGPPLHPTGVWQLPPTQVDPGVHVLPQNPQFLGSLFVFEHPLAQHCSSVLHTGPPLQLAGT